MTDFTTTTTTSVDPATSAALGVFFAIYMVFVFSIALMSFIGLWKTFSKAGKPGWGALIPIYNTILLLEVAGKPIWWFLLFMIPFVNLVILIIVSLEIAKVFGKSATFAVFGLILFSPIGFLMLGFGKSIYTKPATV